MSDEVLDAVRRTGVVAIIRTQDPRTALARAEAVLDAGLDVVELAITGPATLEAIGELVRRRPAAVVGAGTVTDVRQAREVQRLGGRFLVSPNFRPDVVRFARDAGMGSFPGCLTPSEMLGAMEAGASAVKIFPAHLWSPEALRGLLQALPDLSTIPTGGIEPGDAEGWIAAGALAVGVGSALTSAADPAPVAAGLRRAVEAGRLRG